METLYANKANAAPGKASHGIFRLTIRQGGPENPGKYGLTLPYREPPISEP